MASDNADRERLHKICDMSYKAQAIWWLNAFFDTHQSEAEKLWAYVSKAATLDVEQHESGSALDELNAHRLLEIFDETLTVREMRTQLRSVAAITEQERPKLVPLAHLLLARYKSDWRWFVNAPQGASEEIERAQRMLDECKAAFQASEARAQEAAAALAAARAAAQAAAERQAQSEAAAAQAAAAEQELRSAQAALDAALEAVKREEEAYAAKTADLTRKSEEGGVVSRNKAKNELAQHLAEDPLPLRKAKITAEAAAKRNERAIVAAADAKVQAEAAARQAAEATAAAQRAADASAAAKRAADDAVEEARRSLEAAEAFLKEVQATAGGGKGALWWIERELHEQRKYLPTSRGGIAK